MSTATPAVSTDFAVAYRDFMVESITQEMATTKKVLAAVLENKKDYRPDPKSRTAGELAWHIVQVEVQFLHEIADGAFSMEERYKHPGTIAEMVKWYSKELPTAIERVKKMSPEQLNKVLDFYGAFKFPAYFFLSFVEKHSLHHRGQLAAYLRPLGSKVPSIYGGSADEPWEPPK
ncbi:MAG: DinB family protein [Acidobacteriia bacterium]|nr:DinB family protein [Terriglobia bacterium]